MRYLKSLIAASLALAGCESESRVEVTFLLPADPPADATARIAVGEELRDGFRTIVGTDGPAAGPVELAVPRGEGRIARVLIHDGEFQAILHGQSAPFTVEDELTAVEVPLQPPPEGSIVGTVIEGMELMVQMRARRWAIVQLGLLPRQPTHQALREGTPSETFESFSVAYPLDQVECNVDRGCPIVLFVDFLAEDGVAGRTATATLTVDLKAPGLSTRARIQGGGALGSGSRLLVEVEATEPLVEAELTLRRTVSRGGDCAEVLGPEACAGAGSRFTCRVEAPAAACDGSYQIEVSGTDPAGNRSTVTGAEISLDTIPPRLSIAATECASGIAMLSGTAAGATQVALRDSGGNTLAWSEGETFRLAASSSVAASVAAIDSGANEVVEQITCP